MSDTTITASRRRLAAIADVGRRLDRLLVEAQTQGEDGLTAIQASKTLLALDRTCRRLERLSDFLGNTVAPPALVPVPPKGA